MGKNQLNNKRPAKLVILLRSITNAASRGTRRGHLVVGLLIGVAGGGNMVEVADDLQNKNFVARVTRHGVTDAFHADKTCLPRNHCNYS
jgi:hypothetical protein